MVNITPGSVIGELAAPPSKSMTQRAYAAAYLASEHGSDCKIIDPSVCDDALVALNITKTLSTSGLNLVQLDCGEAGLSLRMFTPIAALKGKEVILNARGSLKKRPVAMMEEPLHKLGVHCKTHEGYPPVVVKGPLKAGNVELDGSVTSQFLTGLLMALPCVDGVSHIKVRNLKSRPYVEMTLQLLEHFEIEIEHNRDLSGFKIKGPQRYFAENYWVEGDWSAAAFFLVAGVVSGYAHVMNLNYKNSFQADKKILDVLRLCGTKVTEHKDAVKVMKSPLHPFEFDATDCPDLFPPLVVLALNCNGTSIIKGAERLKHKESDRAQTLLEEFTHLGGKIDIQGDIMKIVGGKIRGGDLDPRNDHRLAMAGAIAGLTSEVGVKILDEHCVNKSYPNFFSELERLMKNE
jgi:3-phosphoshikimate 1-carboxyvinyltransferase